ncbi:MAG: hypothetical protein Q8L27_04120 [archaeon]|nr:hypothetical protein [archaeon]
MNFYLIYIPNGHNAQWEAMSEAQVPDTAAFPNHWYQKYWLPIEKHEQILKKLRDIRDNMNKQKLIPTTERNIFPELTDIVKDK